MEKIGITRYRFGMGDIWDIGIGISSVWGILGISVSVYRYDTNFLMQYLYHISVYRYHTDISVSCRYIGIGIGMDQSSRIGIGLNSLLTHTNISVLVMVSVYQYRSNSNIDTLAL